MEAPRISLTVRGGDVRVPGSGLMVATVVAVDRRECEADRKISLRELSELESLWCSLLSKSFCLLHCSSILSNESADCWRCGCCDLLLLRLLRCCLLSLLVRFGR